jgi:prolyl-tRNA editing enzyme YbaK/EbsC (Cys-tRNA(Pro) deacylase)
MLGGDGEEWLVTLPPGTERMLAAAAERNLPVEVRARPPARSLEEAAELLGITPADIAKTLVVRLPGDRFVFAIVGGDRQIAWPKLRALVGVNKMSLPPAHLALEATGYERGTITPIGSAGDWPLYVDERLVGHRVAMGAGGDGYSAFVAVDDLVAAFQATVADLSDPA